MLYISIVIHQDINNFWCLTHNKNYIAHEKMPSRLNTDAACVSNTLHLISLLSPMSSQTHLELTTTQTTTTSGNYYRL